MLTTEEQNKLKAIIDKLNPGEIPCKEGVYSEFIELLEKRNIGEELLDMGFSLT